MNIGILLPFTDSNGRLFKSSISKMEQTKTNLINLIMTEQGERVMHPTFGVRLKRYLFEPNLPNLVSRIDQEIRSAIEFWLPHVLIEALDITGELDNTGVNGHTIHIRVTFGLTITPTILDTIVITIN